MDDYLSSLQMSICTICGDVTAMDQDEKHECWFCHNPKIKLLTQQQFCEILSKSENQILKEISKREYTIANIDNETESPIIDEYLRNIYVYNSSDFNKGLFDVRTRQLKEKQQQNTQQESQARRERERAEREATRPRCPTCHSTDIKPITVTQKAGNFLMLGIFSQKIKHQFHCNHCGYEW